MARLSDSNQMLASLLAKQELETNKLEHHNQKLLRNVADLTTKVNTLTWRSFRRGKASARWQQHH